MNFDLVKPCDNCPFRRDVQPYLEPERALSIAMELERQSFICHKTVHCPQPRNELGQFARRERQHCAGALGVMKNQNWQGDTQQLAARLGLYRPELIDATAAYESLDAFVHAHGPVDLASVRPPRGYTLSHLPEFANALRSNKRR